MSASVFSIFIDLDGTLIDSHSSVRRSYCEAIQKVTGDEFPGMLFDELLWQRTWPGRLPEIFSQKVLEEIYANRVLPTWNDLKGRLDKRLYDLLGHQNAGIVTSGSRSSTERKLPIWLHHKIWECSAPKREVDFWRGKSGLVIDDDPEVLAAALVAGLATLRWSHPCT